MSLKVLDEVKKIEKPSRMIIEITDRCNLGCIHCFANKKDKDLDYMEWQKIIQNSVDEGENSISITGGEPLLFPSFFEIFRVIEPKNTKITLDTNGTLIDENNINYLKKYFKLVRVSIYGYEDNECLKITNNKFFRYQKVIDAIKLLSDNNIKIQVNIPLFNENIKHLDEIIFDLSKYNIYEIVLIPILNIGKAKDMLDIPTENVAKELFDKYSKKTNLKLRLFKWAEGKHFLVRANGNVYLHPFYVDGKETDFYLGNIMNSSIDNLWANVEEKYKIANYTLTPNLDDI